MLRLPIYSSSKAGNLDILLKLYKQRKLFVCLFFFFQVEISDTRVLLIVLLAPWKYLMSKRVHPSGFVMFRPMMQKLFNFEQFLY
jgi:hypothetical protein